MNPFSIQICIAYLSIAFTMTNITFISNSSLNLETLVLFNLNPEKSKKKKFFDLNVGQDSTA